MRRLATTTNLVVLCAVALAVFAGKETNAPFREEVSAATKH